MPSSPGIVAHLIIGNKSEPYLEAALASIDSVSDHLVVNDNSGDALSIHASTLATSGFARRGAITIVRSTFTDFASARNICLDATPHKFRDGWALFFDADEIHGDELRACAALLAHLPGEVDAVEGYSRHFIGSFGWWHTIARRLCYFRLSPDRRWTGAVHERLVPRSKSVVVADLWHHYGHVTPPRREWEKGRLYHSLGQTGFVATDDQMRAASPADVWGHLAPEVIPFRGAHPPSALETIHRLSKLWADAFADVDRLFSRRPGVGRFRSWVRQMNYSRLLAMRRFEARLRSQRGLW
ncbi:MAG TPA: hypothetical protein VID19_07930 [Candidatus Eremiobacteraceae bacterium]|jgi:hypothetical protein